MCDYTTEEIQDMILNLNDSISKISEVLMKHNEMINTLNNSVKDIISYLKSDSHE